MSGSSRVTQSIIARIRTRIHKNTDSGSDATSYSIIKIFGEALDT